MTTIALAYSNIKKKTNLFGFLNINWKLYYIFSFIIILSLAAFYVIQINNMTHGSYLIKDHQREINALLEENKDLEMNFARADIMEGVREKAEAMSFTRVKEVKYVQILETSLAEAKQNKN